MGGYDNTSIDNHRLTISGADIGTKLGHLPNGTAEEAFRTGANTWDWDRVNKKLYVMGLEGTALSLWDYDYTSDTWNYLTNLAPAVSADDRFPVMSYCNGDIYVISKYDGTFGKYTISGAVNNWTDLPNPTFSGVVIDSLDRVSMCSDGVRYIYALTSNYGQDTANRNFRRFDTISGTWASMDIGYRQYNYVTGGATNLTNTSCLTYDYDKDRVYLINASEERSTDGHYIQLYNVSADSWGTNWFNVDIVYNTAYIVESIWYHNKWLYVSCNPNFDTGYFFRYNLDTTAVEKLNLGYVHYDPVNADIVGVYMIAIDNDESDFGSSVYFAQIDSDRKYLYGYEAQSSLSGTYTSPILKMDDGYSSSYFVVDATTTSGLTSVSYDADSYNGSIRVRSSDTAPIDIDEVYLPTRIANQMYLYKYNLYNGSEVQWQVPTHGTILQDNSASAADRRTGHIAISFNTLQISKAGDTRYYFYVYDSKDGSEVYSHIATGNAYAFDTNMEFDKLGGLWGYRSIVYGSNYHLAHIDKQLVTVLADITSTDDFVYDLAVEMDGTGVWYTHQVNDALYHLDSAGTLLQSVGLTRPRAICGTSGNGCWVIDNSDYYARRYTSSGTISKSVHLGRTATRMCTDYADGFWYVSGSNIYHLNSNGTVLSTTNIVGVSHLRGLISGCVAWSEDNDWVKHINGAGTIVRTINGASSLTGIPGVFSSTYDTDRSFKIGRMPTSYDPVWGTGGSLPWKEVAKDSYFLPKEQYQQVELTLRTSRSAYTPYVNKLIMATAIKIQDIQPQSYKNIYVRTNIPSYVDIGDYETGLKVWWGMEE